MLGSQITYTLTVTNVGPSTGADVVLTDTLPVSVTFVSASDGCGEAQGIVTCSLGTIETGDSATVSIVVTPNSTGDLTNTATVTSSVEDPNIDNNSATANTTVGSLADLSLTKADSPDPVFLGTELTYTLTVTNGGPSPATGVTLTDTLPVEVSIVSSSSSQGSCSGTGIVICTLGTIENGNSATVSIVATPNSTGDLTNIATVTSSVEDPNISDNSATETTTVEDLADLSVSKIDSSNTVLLGNQVTYTLTVSNGGPSGATDVVLTDTLPAAVSFVSSDPSQGSCSGASTIICNLGTIASGNVATVVIVVTPNSTGSLANTATVDSGVADSNPSNNSDSVTTTVGASADLDLTLDDSPDPVLADGEVTYSVTIVNNGPSDAVGVVVSDTLPAESTLESATASQGTCTGISVIVTCDVGTISDGSSATVTVTVTVLSAPTGTTLTNAASVTSGVSDPVASNNSATEDTTITTLSQAELAVTMSGTPDPVAVLESLTYTVTTTNDGPSSATETVLTSFLPLKTTFESATINQGSCSEESGIVTCALGTIADGDSVTATITVAPILDAGGTSITATANVTSSLSDPDENNNTASESTQVIDIADLSVTKVDSPDPVPAGQTLTYEMVVTNNGPPDAINVVITDILPTTVNFALALANRGFCAESSGTITCNVGNVDNGTTVTVVITVAARGIAADTTITNTVSVTSDVIDPDQSNNSASQDTSIISSADLEVTNVDPQNGVIGGKDLDYQITVTNDGPTGATDVTLTDLLPPSVTFVSAIPSQGSCGELSGTVSCNLGSIANGAAVTIPIVVTVQIPLNPEGFEVITSTATVLGAEFDPIQPNNSAEAITEVYTDDDSDGVGDLVEDGAPNDGDGNGDGLPDKDQENVTSLKNAVDERYVTITSEEGTGLVDVNATTNPSPEDSPSEEEFPAGFFSFEVEGLEPGAATTVELVLPEDTIIITYWKYGPTPDDIAPHWYEFLFDGTTGAFIDNNMVTIFFVDGQLGDDDLVANGKIVDAGAPIFAPADLLLVISDSPDPALVAETLTYTLVVTNTGPSLATDVVLTDTLTDARLPDLTFESATPSQGVCSIQFLVVTCDLGDIANQAEATVTIVVTPLENAGAVTITNTATVEANEADSDFTNNIAIELTDVDRQADSSVTITSDPDPVLVGRPLTYTLEVLNGGPSQTTKVTVTDVLPNEVIYESSRPSQGTCDHSDGIVLCYIGSLDNGASATVTILVRPTDVAGGTDLINTATVVSDVADFNPANDGATDNTSVLRSVDLSVDIADAPDPVEVGDRVTYVATITNAGPSLATGVVLTDTLPVGATFESASPSQGNCNEASGTLICNMGAIAKDASATVSITVIPQT